MIIDNVSLFYRAGKSDKEYHVQLVEDVGGCLVNFQYGRRGSTLQTGCKTKAPVSQEAARKVFDKIVAEKTSEGYTGPQGASTGGTYTSAGPKAPPPMADRVVPQLLIRIKEEELERYLRDDSWGAQEKKDGRHQMIKVTATSAVATNKKGIEIGYPTQWAQSLQAGLYDGEAIGDIFHVFDILEYGARDLRPLGYQKRYDFLAGMGSKSFIRVVYLITGYAAKKALYDMLIREKKEGIVFKRLDAPYTAGKAHEDMVKLKFYTEASCIVAAGRPGKRSVALELLDDAGNRVPVGNMTIPPNKDIPQVGTVVEVRYLYAYKGGSLYQPNYEKPRDDVDIAECLMSQLKYKAEED